MRIVLVLVLAGVVAAAFSVFKDRRKMKEKARALGLDAPGVRIVDCEGPMLRFAVKPEERTAYLICGVNAAPVTVPLEDIAGCEFIDGGERRSGIGSALVGAAAADALSGKTQWSVLRILRKDPEEDAVEYRLTTPTYREDFRIFAKQVSELIEEFRE